ncbi:putative phage related protein [Escherichia coli]|uniref:Putative phage related protein n=1 Tax=Escherichia coli TaxID=562 RepID=A0A377A4X2_ECOLX|nr:putative phage related protein [Escherichia coli]
MSQNWMRHFELQLVDGNGQGIELSDFKVTFTIGLVQHQQRVPGRDYQNL